MANRKLDQRAALAHRHKTLENVMVLYTLQSMLGLVSPQVQAVAVEIGPERGVVHFAFERLSDAQCEDVEDLMGDLDALLGNEDLEGEWNLPADWKLESALHVGPPDEHWPGCLHRRVFERKPTAEPNA